MLPTGQTLKLGSRGPSVQALRQRLAFTGDLDPNRTSSATFDSYVESAVKRVQTRHGLGPTGVVGPQTLAALNTPADKRLRQLEINLVRLRQILSKDLGVRFVTANIPAAYVETVEGGRVATRHAAGVGKIDRQSPIMDAKIVEVNFNPFWTVPASIIRKDLIPKMQKEPNYLTEQKIRIFNKAVKSSSHRRSTGSRMRPPTTCSGRIRVARRIRWASSASTFPIRTASTCMTRRRAAFSAMITASSPPLHPRAECPRLYPVAAQGDAGLGSRRD